LLLVEGVWFLHKPCLLPEVQGLTEAGVAVVHSGDAVEAEVVAEVQEAEVLEAGVEAEGVLLL
jgi:hypothetical protein